MAWHPFRNLGLKLVALGLGTLLWFTVSGQQVERDIPDVPVVYRNKPAHLEITSETTSVSVHVRGLDTQLRNAQPRDFEARVDLTGAREGTLNIQLRTDQVEAPDGLEVKQVQPPTVMAVLELSGKAEVPVSPFIDGQPASGFVVSQVTVDPTVVSIVGPARRIAGTTSATTDRVGIEGATETVTANVSVGVLDGLLRLEQPRSARVVVTIERSGDRLFASLRVAVRNAGIGTRAVVEPAVVSVLMRGAGTRLGRIDTRSVAPYVDVAGLGPGRHEVPVLLDLPSTLIAASVRPATVAVTITR